MTFPSEARQLLARASVLAEAPASNLGGGHNGKPDWKPPTTAGGCLYDRMLSRFKDCETDRQWKQALDWAEKELEGVLRAPRRENKKLLVLFLLQGTNYREAAAEVGVDPATVRRWRVEFGQAALDGLQDAA